MRTGNWRTAARLGSGPRGTARGVVGAGRTQDAREILLAVALTALAACSVGGSAHRALPAVAPTTVGTAAPSSSVPAATTTTPPTTALSGAACVSMRAIDAWPATRRAAQLVVVPSLDFNVAGLSSLIRAGAGGVLFLRCGATPPELRQQLISALGTNGPGAAPLVMADVEGGGIQRLQGAVDAFPWPRELTATKSVGEIRDLARIVGQEMMRAGVNVDLAPVVDLDDRRGPSIANPDGSRSFSINPAVAGAYGVAFMHGLRDAGVVPVVKHFPGLGGSTQDTDYGPAATRPWSQLRTTGLKPFIAEIAANAPAIMISNAYVPGLTTKPASVSRAVVHDLLRTQLGFSGLVVTDSLSAGAIRAAGYTVAQAA